MTGPSVEVDRLTKRFGAFTALEGATFRFAGPGAIGYLGPNGAGKTTTLKLLTHLLLPTSGTARVNGIDVADDPKHALWDVGSVIETPEPYPSQTGREALEMVGEFRGIPAGRLAEQIERYDRRLELPPLDRRTDRLSKGQRQRLVIAAALLSEPAVLLLDEPTSGLDPAERVAVRNLLIELKRERLILMSSHLLSEVTEICDRVVFVNGGRILLEDTVEGIQRRFQVNEVTVEFLEPLAPGAADRLKPPVSAVTLLDPRRLRIELAGGNAARADVLSQCLTLGRVIGFSPGGSSLEEAYLRLVAPEGPPLLRMPPPPPGWTPPPS